MSIRLQVVIIIGILIVLAYIFDHVKKQKMDLRYALGWIIVSICILIVTIFPVLLEMISGLVGISTPVNMLFFFGFILMVFLIFGMSVTISQLSDRVKKLAQEIAILRKDSYNSELKEEEEKL